MKKARKGRSLEPVAKTPGCRVDPPQEAFGCPGRGTMHVLVDGSNVAQGLPSLRRVWRQDRDRARDLLVSMAREIHDGWSWQVTVVFDGRGSEIACSYPWGVDTFAVIFSPSNLTADAVIERMGLRSADPSRIAVVSADHMILDSLRAAGAQTVSPQVFEEWVEACRRSIREKSDRRDHSSAGAFENRLDIPFHPES